MTIGKPAGFTTVFQMNADDYDSKPQWYRERRLNAGKTSLNRGIAAVAVALAGDLLGFFIPWAVSSAQPSNGPLVGRAVLFPVGGIVSLMLALIAISIGRKVKKFIDGLAGFQSERISSFVDLEKQRRYASTGIGLGIASIVFNPLLIFGLITVIRIV